MIKEDKLNIDSFTENGKNYRKARVVDQAKLTDYLVSQGFKVLEIQQLWRHVHGKLEKNSKIYFFKMASTPDISERTRNEVSWNKRIHDLVNESAIDYFDVPEVFDVGEYDDKFYYLSSYHDGQTLATKNPPSTEGLDKWIDKIVKSNLFFLSLPELNLQKDGTHKPINEKWDVFFKRIQSWFDEVKEFKLDKVFDEVDDLEKTYEPAVNHGDFVPWHMIDEGRQFILIDAEHASSYSPKYYDVCYFYHRLYTSANAPELAKEYFGKIKHSLSDSEKNKFNISVRPILATRIIGGFWDAKTDGLKNVSSHNNLKNDFLNRNLF